MAVVVFLPCTLTLDNISSYLVFIIVASLLGRVENIQEDEEKDDEGHEEEEKKKSNYANAHSRLNSHVCLVYFLVP